MLLFNGIYEPVKRNISVTNSPEGPGINTEQQFAKEMANAQLSSVSKQLQKKDVSIYSRNQSFLEKVQEAALLQRMGVNKEKLEELKEQLAVLEKQFADGNISQKDYQEQRAIIEEEIAKEYEQAQKRREEQERAQGNT
ncbi:hypothetical protein HG263_09235 [Pseudoalteromonas sp. JBTF-M23]|uniref:Uncharacterized protein n=1 Tax=Pseudoalteromonas caenipelagi TaxID=2726988 RepID=A0A849VD27_9GAMM|nr:hypothetical protein [Pseudoalteromonas caenipelagi]NOU50718.1 hypothetical protein [Pseudoalteromonas caenipelagi]